MKAWVAKPLYGWPWLSAVLSLLKAALSVSSSLPLNNSIETSASLTENNQPFLTASDFTTETAYHPMRNSYTYTPEPRPELPTSTIKLVEEGLSATGTVWQDASPISYVLVVHPSSSACQYPQPTGSGSSYSSCCFARSFRFYADAGYGQYRTYPTLVIPSNYRVESSCANGLVYMTPDATAPLAAKATDGVFTESSRVWVKPWLSTMVTTDDKGDQSTFISTVGGVLFRDPKLPYTEFACLPSEGDCRSQHAESVALRDAAQTRRLDFVEQIRLSELAWAPAMCAPWARSEPLDTRTDPFSKTATEPDDMSCELKGAHVTVYHFAASQSSTAAPRPFCSDGVSKLPFAQQKRAVDVTNQHNPQPSSALKKARLTIPITHWGNWSWQDGRPHRSPPPFSGEIQNIDWIVDTLIHTRSVTLTTKEMAADKVYLHFDELTVERWSKERVDASGGYFLRSLTSSQINNIFLEIKTAELSTWGKYGEAYPVNFKDFEWPYATLSWAAQCANYPPAACGTILQDRLYPYVSFPDRLTEEYPDLSGCIFPGQFNGATDPPAVAPPATDANGQSATALPTLSMPAVVWSQIPQPQAVPQSPEPRATGGTVVGDQQGQQNPMGQGHVGVIAGDDRVGSGGDGEGGGGGVGGVGGNGGGVGGVREGERMPNAAPGGVAVALGNDARITAVPDGKGKGVLINGMLLTTNGVITLSDGRKITVDTNGNLVLDGKPAGASAGFQNSPKASQTNHLGAYDSAGDGTQAVSPSLPSQTGNSRHKKSQASTLSLIHFGTPFILLALIMAL